MDKVAIANASKNGSIDPFAITSHYTLNHIASLFLDPEMQARMDTSFVGFMASANAASVPTRWRHIGPKLKYNISFQCEPVTILSEASNRVVILCTIQFTEDSVKSFSFCLRSEMAIPGDRIAIVDALHVPEYMLKDNFTRTAINYYKSYRVRYHNNFAASIVSTAMGNTSNNDAAMMLVNYLSACAAGDRNWGEDEPYKFSDFKIPEEIHREDSTADTPDDTEDEPKYDLNDPRSLAEALRNIQKH